MRTKILKFINYTVATLVVTILITFPMLTKAQSTMKNDKELATLIDQMLTGAFNASEPGAAVIVVRNGQMILRKGYGMANLELGVPVVPEMVFRLASITKQFTAVAILMLVEEGKVALRDDITEFLPDFPTHGHKVTIEQLLTHTASIKNYVDMPELPTLWRKEMTLDDLKETT